MNLKPDEIRALIASIAQDVLAEAHDKSRIKEGYMQTNKHVLIEAAERCLELARNLP